MNERHEDKRPNVTPEETPALHALVSELTPEEIETGILEGSKPVVPSVTAEEIRARVAEAAVERALGDALERARASRGLSLAQVASRLGVSAPRVFQIEHAESNLELSTLLRYAGALGYDVTLTLTPSDGDGEPIHARPRAG